VNLADVDWTVLRRPLIILVVSVAVSTAFVSAAYYYSTDVQSLHRKEARRLILSRARYLTLDDEKRLIQEYYPQFEELTKQGRIGEEKRLNWIESLRQVAAVLKLPSLKYEIGAQSEFEPDFPIASGRFGVFVSEMTLTAGLLHEEDLPRIFQQLERKAAGLFSVSSCRVTPTQAVFQSNPTKPNLEAQCQLRWYVVKLKEQETPRGRRSSRSGRRT